MHRRCNSYYCCCRGSVFIRIGWTLFEIIVQCTTPAVAVGCLSGHADLHQVWESRCVLQRQRWLWCYCNTDDMAHLKKINKSWVTHEQKPRTDYGYCSILHDDRYMTLIFDSDFSPQYYPNLWPIYLYT